MPEFTGQLGIPLKITLTSILLGCRWSHPEAMAGTTVRLWVQYGYAGDGNPVEFTVFQEGGGKVATVKGSVLYGIAAPTWAIPANAQGRFVFVANAPDIELIGKSDTLTILPRCPLGPVEVLDEKGAATETVQLGTRTTWSCKAPGIADGTTTTWKIWCQLDPAHRLLVAAGFGEVQQGKCVVNWTARYPGDQGSKSSQQQLDALSETYQHATFLAVFECLAATAQSKNLGVRSFVGFETNAEDERPTRLAEGKEVSLSPEDRHDDLGLGSVERKPFDLSQGD
jgi:hypothetical protein